jgi:hypothetical protein
MTDEEAEPKPMNYFSQADFQTFSAGWLGRLRLEWIALTGRAFNSRENEELKRRLESFFHKPEKTRGRQILETFWEEDR